MKGEYCDNEVPANSAKCPSCGAAAKAPPSASSHGDVTVPNSMDKGLDEKFCESCGQVIKKEAEICVKCGVRQKVTGGAGVGNKSKITAIVLGVLLGALGVHNFYLGHTKKAVIQLLITILTLSYGAIISWIWAISDVIEISRGNIKDSDGNTLQ